MRTNNIDNIEVTGWKATQVQSGSLAASMGMEPSMLMYAALVVLVNLAIVNLIFIESYWSALLHDTRSPRHVWLNGW